MCVCVCVCELCNSAISYLWGLLPPQDEAAFDQVFQQANFKEFSFKVRAKMDTFNVSSSDLYTPAVTSTPSVVHLQQSVTFIRHVLPLNTVESLLKGTPEIRTPLY